jgi:hypothetical protein
MEVINRFIGCKVNRRQTTSDEIYNSVQNYVKTR